MHYLTNLWREMRAYPLIGIVTVTGTALSLFLVMLVVMIKAVDVIPVAPESNRARFLYCGRVWLDRIESENNSWQTPFSYKAIDQLYSDMPHVEALAIMRMFIYPETVGLEGERQFKTDCRDVNPGFWDVFDFTFLSGRPFSEAEFRSGAKVAVISEDLARKVFGSIDAVGKEIIINYGLPYRIVGVVRDVPEIADSSYAQIWITIPDDALNPQIEGHRWVTGSYTGVMLADREGCREEVRAELARRREGLNSLLKDYGWQLRDLGAPYLVNEFRQAQWGGFEEVDSSEDVKWACIVAILLLVPAINLGNMTRSRLRRRTTEIGIRRAFGCSRTRLMLDILTENMILTLAGGLIGFIATILLGWLGADMLWMNSQYSATSSFVTLSEILDWRLFLWALAVCFVLNLLSNGIPAFKAARQNPVEAIGGLQK